MGKIRVPAAKAGVSNRSDGSIVVFNPKGSTEDARAPIIDVADLARFQKLGLVSADFEATADDAVAAIVPGSASSLWEEIMAKQNAQAAEAVADAPASDAPVTSFATTAYAGGPPQGLEAADPDAAPGVEGAGAGGSILDLSIPKLTAEIATSTDVAVLEDLLAAEKAKENPRAGAVAAIEERIEAIKAADNSNQS
jgi:hypothetical protein